jgi:hypothetical protein
MKVRCGIDWQRYEREGWSWAVGWNPNYGGYYAQMWRPLKRPIRVNGVLKLRECLTEHGATIAAAEVKLQDRIGPKLGGLLPERRD